MTGGGDPGWVDTALDQAFPAPDPQVIQDSAGGFWVRINGAYRPFTMIRATDRLLDPMPTERDEIERRYGRCVEVRP